MKYPSGIKRTAKVNNINYANRGMSLEEDINLTNQYYHDEKIAYIYKKPTPIQINQVKYYQDGPRIKDAFFKEASTTDYNGLYNGLYIDFDVKESSNKTSFPISNIHNHQIEHLRNINDNKGISFLIVRFNKLDKNYLILTKDLLYHIDNYDKKSISVSYFEEKAHLLELKYRPRLDYLKVIERLYGGKNGKSKEKQD